MQRSAHIVIGKCQNTWRTVVGEVHKHVIVGAAAETKRAKVLTALPEASRERFDDGTFQLLALPAHLLITFPLALAESPFSTARKFSGVTLCRKQPLTSH